MRVGIYIRVSTLEQALEGYSIGAQTEKLKAYCKAKSWTVTSIYTDPGYSGSNTERPGLKKLISDIQQKKIEMVLVYKLDRLSRSQKDTLFLIEDIFLKNGIHFVSMNENFDTSSPFGRAMIGILSVFAQLEREQIKERSALGREARAKAGLFHGGSNIPIGYDYDPVTSQLIINEYEALQVKEIGQMFLKGYTFNKIRKIMRSKYTNRYGSWYSDSSVKSCLRSPVYNGKIIFNGKIFDGQHEAIFDDITFNAIQARDKSLGSNLTGSQKNAFMATQLLTGMIWCGKCGARYYSKRNSSKHPDHTPPQSYYTCYSRGKSNRNLIIDPNCKNKNWNTKVLDQIIIDEIKKLAFDESYFNQIIEDNEVNNNIEILTDRILDIDKQIGKLINLYQLDGIDFDLIKAKIAVLNEERNNLQREIDTADAEEKAQAVTKCKEILATSTDILDNGSFDDKRLLIQSLIDKIIFDGEDIQIYWSFV